MLFSDSFAHPLLSFCLPHPLLEFPSVQDLLKQRCFRCKEAEQDHIELGIQDLDLYVCVFPLRSQLPPCSKGTSWYLSIVVPGVCKSPKERLEINCFGKENPQENLTYIKIVRCIQIEH